MDTASSTDGSVLNDEDTSNESGDAFAVSAAVAIVSLFALTDICMSHFDIQTNEDSFSTAQRFMEHASEARISGDESKLNMLVKMPKHCCLFVLLDLHQQKNTTQRVINPSRPCLTLDLKRRSLIR
jgi:hypothetical protein